MNTIGKKLLYSLHAFSASHYITEHLSQLKDEMNPVNPSLVRDRAIELEVWWEVWHLSSWWIQGKGRGGPLASDGSPRQVSGMVDMLWLCVCVCVCMCMCVHVYSGRVVQSLLLLFQMEWPWLFTFSENSSWWFMAEFRPWGIYCLHEKE